MSSDRGVPGLTGALLLRGLLIFYLTWSLAMVPLVILRLLNIFNSAVLIRVGLTALVPGLIVLLAACALRGGVLDQVMVVVTIIFCWGVVWGFVRGNPAAYIVADTGAVGIAVASYAVARQPWSVHVPLDRVLSWFSAAFLLAFAGLVGVGYVLWASGIRFWVSLGSVILLLPLSYYLATGRRTLALTSLLIILAGSKAGVVAAALFIVGLYFFTRTRARGFALSSAVLATLMILNVLWYGAAAVDWDSQSLVGRGFEKVLVGYNPWRVLESPDSPWLVHRYLPMDFGGGRVAEVSHAFDELTALNTAPLLTGGGHGFSYNMWYFGQYLEERRNVHVSPVSLVIRYGVPLTLLFYLILFRSLGRSYRYLTSTGGKPVEWALWYFCLGSLCFSLTAFSAFNLTLFWFFLAFLASAAARHRALTRAPLWAMR